MKWCRKDETIYVQRMESISKVRVKKKAHCPGFIRILWAKLTEISSWQKIKWKERSFHSNFYLIFLLLSLSLSLSLNSLSFTIYFAFALLCHANEFVQKRLNRISQLVWVLYKQNPLNSLSLYFFKVRRTALDSENFLWNPLVKNIRKTKFSSHI